MSDYWPGTKLPQPIDVFVALADLFTTCGLAPLNAAPGCRELQVDDDWWIAGNGHNEEKTCSRGAPVIPFSVYVEYRGWPTGNVTPHEARFMAEKSVNIYTFLEAIKTRTKKEKLSKN